MAEAAPAVTVTSTPAPAAATPAAPSQAVPAAATPVAPQRLYDPADAGPATGPVDPTNWSAAQKDAHSMLQQLRAQLFNRDGSLNHQMKARFNACRDFCYGSGALPDFMSAPKVEAPNRFVREGELSPEQIESVYGAAKSAEEYHVTTTNLPASLAGDPAALAATVGAVRETLHALKLPANVGTEIINEVLDISATAHRVAEQYGNPPSTFLSGNNLAEQIAECDRVLAIRGGYQQVASEADAYIRSTLGPQGYEQLKAQMTRGDAVSAVALSPLLLLRLSSLARARGIVR